MEICEQQVTSGKKVHEQTWYISYATSLCGRQLLGLSVTPLGTIDCKSSGMASDSVALYAVERESPTE